MKTEPMSTGKGTEEEIAALVQQLQATQQRLQELTGGEVDAVHLHNNQYYLLQPAQERLLQSEERFRNMFTAAAIGIAISTPTGRFLHANQAYCRMLGYTEEELRSLNFASLTHPDDLALNLKLRDELLAGERENFFLEKRYLKKNDDIVWTRHTVSATHGVGGGRLRRSWCSRRTLPSINRLSNIWSGKRPFLRPRSIPPLMASWW
jgi:PAS domain S-box-containing protein